MEEYYNQIQQIKFFDKIDHLEPITSGYSGSLCCRVKSNDKEYFVKIRSRNTVNFDANLEIFDKNNVLTPKLYDKGLVDGKQYFITEYIEGKHIKKHYDELTYIQVYNYGKKIGSEQKEIANLPSNTLPAYSSPTMYHVGKMRKTITGARELLEQHKDKTTADQYIFIDKFYKQIFDRYENLEQIFINETEYYCHSDIKLGNFIYHDQKLYSVDFEETAHDNIAYKLRSEFFDIFECQPIRYKTWFFIKGFLDEFFNGTIPDTLPKALELMLYYILSKRLTERITQDKFDVVSRLLNNLAKNIKEFGKIENIFNFNGNVENFLKNHIGTEINKK